MLKTLSAISLVATVAVAQGIIPSGISEGCSTFLTSLNTDDSLAKCMTALTTSLAAFAPGANGTASASDVSSALSNVCGEPVTSSCATTVFSKNIAAFQSSCTAELTTNLNEEVLKLYDTLYVVPALQKVLCAKNDDGQSCAATSQLPSGASTDSLKTGLFVQSGSDVVPNTDTFSKYNIPFLFINPDSADLCTTCTRNVLNVFIQQESDIPYAPGLDKSLLLGTQTDLYKAVLAKCDPSFMEGEVKAAGGISQGSIFGSPSAASPSLSLNGLVAAIAGFATLAVSVF